MVKKGYKYNLRIKSKLHPEIFHTIKIDLYCYEKISDKKNVNLKCYEKMPVEKELLKNYKKKKN